MTGSDDQHTQIDPVEQEAVAWVRRLTSGQMTTADAEALKLWRKQSAAHAAAFSAASRLWKDLEPAGRSWRHHAVARPSQAGRRPSPIMSRRLLLAGGLSTAAAAAAVYAIVKPPLGLWPSWIELQADYRTSTGEQRDVALSVDVSVRMNTQTSLAVRAADRDTERVELIGGEASFSKRAGEGRALAVLAADRWITANAAQFDVRHMHGRIASSVCVTCLQGALTIARGTDATALSAGEQLRYDSGGPVRVDAADPEIASAWQRGVLIFRATPLTDVVEEINRYRPGRIVVVNSELGRVPVSGRFRIDALDEVLSQMQQAFGAKIRTLPGGLVLLS